MALLFSNNGETKMADNVIDLFSRKKNKEDDKTEASLDLEEIAKQNAIKAERMAKDRVQHNHRVTREYKLKPKR